MRHLFLANLKLALDKILVNLLNCKIKIYCDFTIVF